MRIKFFTSRPQCFQFGGFDIQMNDTMNAIKENGLDVSGIDYWEQLKDFDIAHFWGLSTIYEQVLSARSSGKKVVITLLLPYTDTVLKRFRRQLGNQIFPERKKDIRMLQEADHIVVLNQQQKEIANRVWDVKEDRISIIPNIVNPNFFQKKRDYLKEEYKVDNYVLSVGNICRRKNQLNLAKAFEGSPLSLVIIGSILDSEESYGMELQKIVAKNSNIIWIDGLENGSNELVAAYQFSTLFALPSFSETQPISALEAVVCKKPLLLANRTYANQEYFNKACLINPSSISDLQKGIEKVFKNPRLYIDRKVEIDSLTKEAVGKKYSLLYEKLMKE